MRRSYERTRYSAQCTFLVSVRHSSLWLTAAYTLCLHGEHSRFVRRVLPIFPPLHDSFRQGLLLNYRCVLCVEGENVFVTTDHMGEPMPLNKVVQTLQVSLTEYSVKIQEQSKV